MKLSAPGCPSGEGKELGEQEGHFPPGDEASVALALAGCPRSGAGDCRTPALLQVVPSSEEARQGRRQSNNHNHNRSVQLQRRL